MASILGDDVWLGRDCYVTAAADLRHHAIVPEETDLGTTCLVAFGSDLFRSLDAELPRADMHVEWPYATTPLRVATTPSGMRFSIHFPSYGGTRIANSLEQLAACGVREVIGLGMGGTPRTDLEIGDTVLLEGSIRGDGVSRYYAPVEFPAVADLELVTRLRAQLLARNTPHRVGLSFGTDALYREGEGLVARLRELGVLTIDLESSALFTVGRRLGIKCAWIGVVSDRLGRSGHEGNIHSANVMDRLLSLSELIVDVIDAEGV
jgi:uridine phosphorylase